MPVAPCHGMSCRTVFNEIAVEWFACVDRRWKVNIAVSKHCTSNELVFGFRILSPQEVLSGKLDRKAVMVVKSYTCKVVEK